MVQLGEPCLVLVEHTVMWSWCAGYGCNHSDQISMDYLPFFLSALVSHVRISGPIRCSPFSSIWKGPPSNFTALGMDHMPIVSFAVRLTDMDEACCGGFR